MIAVLAAGVVTSLAVTLLAAAIVIPILRCAGLVDIPTARSSHLTPVARGGGFAVGCGIAAGSVAAAWIGTSTGVFTTLSAALVIGIFVVFTWCFSILGFMDDMGSMSSGLRLVLQVLIAGAFATLLSLFDNSGVFGLAAVALGVVFIVNGVNFMDGLNALTSSWAVLVGVWYCVLFVTVAQPAAAALSAVFAAAALGFLPYNIGRARAFLGDVGSYGVGAAVAAFAVFLFVSGVSPLVVAAPIVLLVFDVSWTLLKRLLAGENIFQAHRRHIYQQTQQQGLSHEQTSAAYALLNACACLATIPTLLVANELAVWVSAFILVCLIVVYSRLPVLARWSVARRAEAVAQ
ncbi:putative undecaprenyl-phosphate N-acetylglucosaminyl 1-phosphate transferase [Brevibacterium ravenspurgense]|uniref:Putative undecaprenyl-phosphate N-acetylglucosaminyl 1-phosphate transferase n=1 Tax=Brevibacterium ravenspurgense TaxID=479117 RepID=A0A150H621_9MICO|nr:hypothetical protein [Brevibacterium ravenspurgense]KXZ57308.1 putative undecaprenyl-phosphate N-acetylglucosaminyl 1-phosphate transferase [Brevibacterium ravenspurgense]